MIVESLSRLNRWEESSVFGPFELLGKVREIAFLEAIDDGEGNHGRNKGSVVEFHDLFFDEGFIYVDAVEQFIEVVEAAVVELFNCGGDQIGQVVVEFAGDLCEVLFGFKPFFQRWFFLHEIAAVAFVGDLLVDALKRFFFGHDLGGRYPYFLGVILSLSIISSRR